LKERPHKYEVALSEEQRFLLQQLLSHGKAPVRQQAPARILLKIDRNAPGPRWTDEQVAEAFTEHVSHKTVRQVLKNWRSTHVPTTHVFRKSAGMKAQNNCSRTKERAFPGNQASRSGLITPLKPQGCASSSWQVNH
jgi:hypothetical protein